MQPRQLIERILTYYDAGTLQSFVRLKKGFANENYKIVTDKGKFLFRVHRQQSPENVEKEHALLHLLKKTGFPAAFPVPAKSGKTILLTEQFPISLYDFIEGTMPALNPETVSQTATALALLHTVNPENVPQKKNTLRPKETENLVKLFPRKGHPLQELLQNFSRRWEELKPFLYQELPQGIIHGDLFPDNTLFEKNKLKAILDFEEFCTDNLLFDVAMTVNGFCFQNNVLKSNLLDVFLKAYGQKRPLTSKEEQLLPVYIRWTALAMASWHLWYHLLFRPNAKQEKRVRELLERASRQKV